MTEHGNSEHSAATDCSTPFTPGPWKAVRSLTCGHLRAEHNYQQDPMTEWTDADLALISSAPDLLSTVQSLLTLTNPFLEHDDRESHRIRRNAEKLLERIGIEI